MAEFERQSAGARFFLCTQNVDGLHEAAGSKSVVHIHGKLFESKCADDCGRAAVSDYAVPEVHRLPNQGATGAQCLLVRRAAVCNIFLAIGTSGSVQPVAGFVGMLKRRPDPATTIYVGLEEPANSHAFDQIHLGPASSLVTKVLRGLLGPG